MKVFLGGTCNSSTWRDELIPLLDEAGIDYFNPVVEDWTPECQAEEERQKKEECDIHLYVITSKMKGVYSIAEAVNSTYQEGKMCVFHVIPDGFDEAELKSLEAVADLIKRSDGIAIVCISDSFEWIPFVGKAQIPAAQPTGKTLHNSDVSGARVNVKDLSIVGNGDAFQLLCKASSQNEGWMKSTKAMEVHNGCLVQVTTQQRNPDGSYAVAEALAFVPDVYIGSDKNNGRRLFKK